MGLREWNARRKLSSAGITTYGGPTKTEQAKAFGAKVWSGTKTAATKVNDARERVAKSEGYKKFNTWADGAADNFHGRHSKSRRKKSNDPFDFRW